MKVVFLKFYTRKNPDMIFRIGTAPCNHSYPWNGLECHQCWQTDTCFLHHAGYRGHRSCGHYEQGRRRKYQWSLQQVGFHLLRWTRTFYYFYEWHWTGMCSTSQFSSVKSVQRKREARNFLSVIIVQQRLVKTISYSSNLLQKLPHG